MRPLDKLAERRAAFRCDPRPATAARYVEALRAAGKADEVVEALSAADGLTVAEHVLSDRRWRGRVSLMAKPADPADGFRYMAVGPHAFVSWPMTKAGERTFHGIVFRHKRPAPMRRTVSPEAAVGRDRLRAAAHQQAAEALARELRRMPTVALDDDGERNF